MSSPRARRGRSTGTSPRGGNRRRPYDTALGSSNSGLVLARRSRSTFSDFYFSRENKNQVDVTFIVGGAEHGVEKPEVFRAHKSMLSAGSTVFEAMFNGHMLEGRDQETRIELPDVHPDAFYIVLKHLYNQYDSSDDQLDVPTHSSVARREFQLSYKSTKFFGYLVYAADKYNIQPLSRMCISRMNDRLDVSNAVTIYELCHKHNLSLERKAREFLIKNFDEVSMDPDFLNFTTTTLMMFLGLDDIVILEHDLFLAVFKWAKAKCSEAGIPPTAENCRETFSDVFNLIRFPTISSANFAKHVATVDFLATEEMCTLFKYIAVRGESNSGKFVELPNLPYPVQPRNPYEGKLYFNVEGPYDSTSVGGVGSAKVTDMIISNHDIMLTSVTYCPMSEIPNAARPYRGELTIEEIDEVGTAKQLFVFSVSSILDRVDPHPHPYYDWIRFDLGMNVVLKASVRYSIILKRLPMAPIPQFLTYCSQNVGSHPQIYNKRFTLTVYPVDKAIRRIGFVLV